MSDEAIFEAALETVLRGRARDRLARRIVAAARPPRAGRWIAAVAAAVFVSAVGLASLSRPDPIRQAAAELSHGDSAVRDRAQTRLGALIDDEASAEQVLRETAGADDDARARAAEAVLAWRRRRPAWIAYIGQTGRKGPTDHVHVVDPAGGETRRLTPDFGDFKTPAFRPDGSRVAVQTHDGILELPLDGGAPRRHVGPYSDPVYGPDGASLLARRADGCSVILPGAAARLPREAAFESAATLVTAEPGEKEWTLRITGLDGAPRRVVATVPVGEDPARSLRNLAVRGDRAFFERLATERKRELWCVDLDSGASRVLDRIEFANYFGALEPTPSPDGSRVAYFNATTLGLWVIDADGKNRRELPHGRDACATPAWSPEGTRIAYVRNPNGSASAWIHDLVTGEDTRLAEIAWESGLAWSARPGR